MPMPVYPPELPNPLRDGYQYALGDGRFRSPADTGLPNMRARFSTVPDRVDFATILDQFRYGIFWKFVVEDLKRAALPFIIANHIEDGRPLLDEDGIPVLDEDDVPVLVSSNKVAVFDQMPVIRPRGIDWHVSFTMLVTPT